MRLTPLVLLLTACGSADGGSTFTDGNGGQAAAGGTSGGGASSGGRKSVSVGGSSSGGAPEQDAGRTGRVGACEPLSHRSECVDACGTDGHGFAFVVFVNQRDDGSDPKMFWSNGDCAAYTEPDRWFYDAAGTLQTFELPSEPAPNLAALPQDAEILRCCRY